MSELKTKYKYIHFEIISKKSKTFVYGCYNSKSGTLLGEIKWYSAWRQYCYFPIIQAVYSDGCLDDISNFIKQLKGE